MSRRWLCLTKVHAEDRRLKQSPQAVQATTHLSASRKSCRMQKKIMHSSSYYATRSDRRPQRAAACDTHCCVPPFATPQLLKPPRCTPDRVSTVRAAARDTRNSSSYRSMFYQQKMPSKRRIEVLVQPTGRPRTLSADRASSSARPRSHADCWINICSTTLEDPGRYEHTLPQPGELQLCRSKYECHFTDLKLLHGHCDRK